MVTRSQVRDEIWNLIRDRLVSNVKTITLLNSSVITIQNYINSFNDLKIKNKSDLPIIIIEPPKFNSKQHTFTESNYEGTITISVYTTQREAAIKFMDAINETLELYRKTMKLTNGIRFWDIDDEDDDSANLEIFRGYFQSIRYKFNIEVSRW